MFVTWIMGPSKGELSCKCEASWTYYNRNPVQANDFCCLDNDRMKCYSLLHQTGKLKKQDFAKSKTGETR